MQTEKDGEDPRVRGGPEVLQTRRLDGGRARSEMWERRWHPVEVGAESGPVWRRAGSRVWANSRGVAGTGAGTRPAPWTRPPGAPSVGSAASSPPRASCTRISGAHASCALGTRTPPNTAADSGETTGAQQDKLGPPRDPGGRWEGLEDSWGSDSAPQETVAPGQDPRGLAGWHLGHVPGVGRLLVHHLQFF